MSNKITIDEKMVIREYLSGKSSLILSKEFGVSKPIILKVLNKHNITRKRDRCETLEYKIINYEIIPTYRIYVDIKCSTNRSEFKNNPSRELF